MNMYLGHSISNQTVLPTMSSPVFMIFILQVDIHEVNVFPKCQLSVVTKTTDINEIRQFLAGSRPCFHKYVNTSII
jgi:hypothetical protein